MHKKVQVVIVDISRKPFRVLLLKTNQKRGSFWQNVTGSAEGNETFYQAAIRELSEETKLSANKLIDLDFSFTFASDQGDVVEQCYLAILQKTPEKVEISEKEHQDYKWAMANEITESQYKYPSNYQAFLKAKVHCEKFKA